MELKDCPKCQKQFECKPENVGECGCSQVYLSPQQRIFIADQHYDDCLCVDCLQLLKQEYQALQNGGTNA